MIDSKSRPRVNYDAIAPSYDGQPYRDKDVDPHLLRFLRERQRETASLSILDMGCGTGNQLVANRQHVPGARLVGLDLCLGMLRQASPKATGVLWVQADSARPSFPDGSFDFITSQYSFHHVRDKSAMIAAVFRLLRPEGRFVMVNICPQEMTGWIYYRYFPAALEVDLRDFLPPAELAKLMREVGFASVKIDLDHRTYAQEIKQFSRSARHREHCSQLLTIPDVDYKAGLQRIDQAVAQSGEQHFSIQSEMCIMTMSGDRP